jgi:hypothetical protein
MLRVSFYTAVLGMTERLFTPCWNPFTVFNLARRDRFCAERANRDLIVEHIAALIPTLQSKQDAGAVAPQTE